MRIFFIIYMGKQLEKLILILGMIILGSVALAQPPVDVLSGENTPVVTRERKVPKPKKEVKQNTQVPKQDKQAKNKPIQKGKKKIQQNPQYLGLKIYDIERPKQPTKKANKKVACKKDPKSPCNIRKAKPIRTYPKIKPPRYTNDRYANNRYSDRYRKFELPKWPPARPARPIPIITCD